MSSFDPYAPPRTDYAAPAPSAVAHPYRTQQDEALRRLRAHAEDPSAVAADLAVAGSRVRVVSMVFAGIGVAAGLAALLLGNPAAQAGFGILAGVFVLCGVILIAFDLMMPLRSEPSTPEKALKAHLRALTQARFGYAWAGLSPTAREQQVSPPELGTIAVTPGQFALSHPDGLKAYASAFVRPGGGHMRQLGIKQMTVRQIDGDVAVLDVHGTFISWPQWVTITMAVGFILFRPLILIGIILYFVKKQTYQAQFQKTMLRAPNGVWYVYDGNLLGP